MKPKAIIFDRDGVLLDFNEEEAMKFFGNFFPITAMELMSHWESWGEKVGFPKTLETETIFFRGFWNHLSDLFQVSEKDRKQLLNLNYLQFLKPYPEVIEVLNQLKNQGFCMAVLSNFSLASLENSLVATQLDSFFEVACAATVIGASKPDPQAYQITLTKLKTQPEQTLFIDDKIVNIRGAKNLGIQTLLLDRSQKKHQMTAEMISDLRGVLQYLEESE